jgi:hypothetical protein
MAYTVGSAFTSFRQNTVDLTANDTQKARSSRDYLFEQIKSLAQNNTDFPRLGGGYLSFGSFARRTKIRPLDDVDVLVLLNGKGTTASHYQGNTYDLKLTDSSAVLAYFSDNLGFYSSPEVNSTKILNKIRYHLGSIHNYRNADIKKTMQAVTLNLGSYDWVFDIVPALPVGDRYGNIEYYLIPDGKGKWIRTNPKIDSENVTRVNLKHDGNFLPIIRLLKYWNNRTHKPRLPSYYFEYLAIKVFENSPKIASTPQAIKYFFDNCPSYIQLPCPDPKQLGANLDSSIDYNTKQKVISAMSQASQLAGNAIWYETKSSSSEALNAWRTIFGSEFPTYG